jgi:hypothetical protein
LSVTLALYTTVYPGVESYLADWYGSVLDQTDRDFQLWIGLDAIDAETAAQYMGGSVDAMWIQAGEGATPAQVRQRAWETLVGRCDEVVLVDSDDVLLPSRVATAREMLRASELAGCALQLVDAGGADLGLTFTSLLQKRSFRETTSLVFPTPPTGRLSCGAAFLCRRRSNLSTGTLPRGPGSWAQA